MSALKMKQCTNVKNAIDCEIRVRMKSRILDSEDTALLAVVGCEKILENDVSSRMWFKRQFLMLREHFNS